MIRITTLDRRLSRSSRGQGSNRDLRPRIVGVKLFEIYIVPATTEVNRWGVTGGSRVGLGSPFDTIPAPAYILLPHATNFPPETLLC